MKKLSLFLLGVVALVMAACSGGAGAQALSDKIAKGDVLTQADYTTLIDYCGDFAKKAQVIQDKIDNLDSNNPAVEGLQSQLDGLKEKFPLLKEFQKVLKNSTPEEVGSENVKKIDELSSLIWFDAPDWAQTVAPGKVGAGLIEDVAPAEADSSIIAAPALEEKTK